MTIQIKVSFAKTSRGHCWRCEECGALGIELVSHESARKEFLRHVSERHPSTENEETWAIRYIEDGDAFYEYSSPGHVKRSYYGQSAVAAAKRRNPGSGAE